MGHNTKVTETEMNDSDILSMVRKNVKALKPYSSARDDFQGEAAVFLDANENPYPSDYNRYPDPHQHRLKEAISKLKGIPKDSIFIGNGSDEAIDLLIRIFCEPGRDSVIIPQPTYGMYSVSAEINDVAIIAPLLTRDFKLDVNQILQRATSSTKLLFLCSPNNPSGGLLPEKDIEYLINNFQGIVVVDEAYIDFAGVPGWLPRLSAFPNLVVLQTFSKAWGLAGLRLGMCLANPLITGLLDKIKPPYNIGAFAQSFVLEQIDDGKENLNRIVKMTVAERQWLEQALSSVPLVTKVHPSHANFLLVQFTDAAFAYRELISRGIIVRDRSNVVLCDNCLRITVGTKEENYKLIEILKSL
jgi:histidinol-phosphate aminotransferase